jgi:sphinganine-1-phosphate aldolase
MTKRSNFPEGGTSWASLKAEMDSLREGDIDWKNGRAPLYVFYNDADTLEIGKRAFNEYFSENALGRKRAFLSVQKMERDVLDFGLDLFSAPDSGHGVFTSGGSESILLAMKAARDTWRARHDGDRGPLNLVMPISAHPAFDKASNLMDIEIRRAPLRDDYRVDVDALGELVDDRTLAIVGSAPCFPHGVVDDIEALSRLAMDKGLWMHVDACVGGWVAPFFAQNGRSTPDFDFRFSGVRSISADLHKFGFCPKPASTVFFRDGADHEPAIFVADAWPNGRFETPTLVGTRPAGSVASAWAVLNHLGTEGYRDVAGRLAGVVDAYVADIEAIDGLRMVATPDLSIINFTSDEVDMGLVADGMKARGWLPGMTQAPKGLHIMMSMFHGPAREDYIADLKEAVAEAREKAGRKAKTEAVY